VDVAPTRRRTSYRLIGHTLKIDSSSMNLQ